MTYKPDGKLKTIIERLLSQTVKPGKIIIMNTDKDSLSPEIESFIRNEPLCELHHTEREAFNHGLTRNEAASYSGAEYLLFMTQDALPAGKGLLSGLLKPMEDPRTAVSYARQLPSKSAGEIERFNRSFNYPQGDRLKTERDFKELGIKTIFCSDVCALYRKSVFDSLGGFIKTDFNEDMIFAFNAINTGYGIYYASEARVIHSHDLTALQQFRRNVDLGASQKKHPEVFGRFKSEGEGKRLVREGITHFIRKGKPYLIPVFLFHCAARYAGFLTGKHVKSGEKEK